MKELSHPNILKIHKFERSNHSLSLLLEYIEGGTFYCNTGDLRKYTQNGFELE